VILLADSIRSRLLSWFGSLIIKKISEYHPPKVDGSVEIQMFIMYNNRTIPSCSKFGCRNDDRYIDILLPCTCSQAFIAQSVRRRIFYVEVRGSYPVGARNFLFLLSFLLFLYIQMFFYTIMKLFVTLLQNVNRSRTSAGRLSLMTKQTFTTNSNYRLRTCNSSVRRS
jgi:hypothetical protein